MVNQSDVQVRSKPMHEIRDGDTEVTYEPVKIPATPFIQGRSDINQFHTDQSINYLKFIKTLFLVRFEVQIILNSLHFNMLIFYEFIGPLN